MKTRLLAPIVAAAVGASALPASALAETHATAELEPREVAVGEPAQLVVEVDGEQGAVPAVPRVAGVDITPLGRSQQITVTNGVPDFVTSYRYAVVATHAGSYTIPSIAAGAGRTAPIVFVATGSSPATSSRQARTGAPSTPSFDEPAVERAAPGRAFLRVILPKRRLVVGESVPITVKAYFSPGTSATLEAPPELTSDAFAVHGLTDRATRSEESVRGVPYAVLTWRGRLTALLAGQADLGAHIPATLQYREPVRVNPQARARRDPFGWGAPFDDDPFFSSFFASADAMFDDMFEGAGREVSRHVTLRDGAGSVSVTPLPDEGRPPGTVAVGRFELSSTATPATVAVGSPVTLRVAVTGEGTFDRVALQGLATNPSYRAYAATESFTASDTLGLAGTRTFEQSVVPDEAGALTLPALSLTYYDPTARAYVTRSTAPIQLTVTPSASGATRARTLDAPVATGLRPDRVNTGPSVGALLPVPHSAAWLLAPLALLGLALAVPRVANREPSEARRRRRAQRIGERAVRAARARMERARRAGDPEAFFAAARAALQARAAVRLGVKADAVTLAEFEAHPELGDEARRVFAEADRVAFSGATAAGDDLNAWQARVERALEETAR